MMHQPRGGGGSFFIPISLQPSDSGVVRSYSSNHQAQQGEPLLSATSHGIPHHAIQPINQRTSSIHNNLLHNPSRINFAPSGQLSQQQTFLIPAGGHIHNDRPHKVYVGAILHERDMRPNLIPAQFREYGPFSASSSISSDTGIQLHPRTIDGGYWHHRENAIDGQPPQQSENAATEAPNVLERPPLSESETQIESSSSSLDTSEKRNSTAAGEKNPSRPAYSNSSSSSSQTEREAAEPRFIIIVSCVAIFLLLLLTIVTLSTLRHYQKLASRATADKNPIPSWRNSRPQTNNGHVLNSPSTFDPQERWFYGTNFTATHR